MANEEIHPHPKELDIPYKNLNEDDIVSDILPDAEAPRLKLFGRILTLVFAVVFNAVFFVVINFYYEHIPFLTDDFPRWIPYANISLVANMVLQVLLFFLGDTVFKPLLEAGTNIVSIISLTAFLVIFPVDFDVITWLGPLEDILRIGTVILIFILVIVTIANIASFFGKLLKTD